MAQVVYTSLAEGASNDGSLFNGVKFWLSATVPSKTTIREYIESNGGLIVRQEKEADVKLVDHLKKIQPEGRYIENSVRRGRLENIDDHRCGPVSGTSRPVGSVSRPGKTTRTPFTAEDDRVLIQWVANSSQKGGGTAGNEIYKQLELHNPRHTWQSWRDRFVQRYRGIDLPPPTGAASTIAHPASTSTDVPPTPPSEQSPLNRHTALAHSNTRGSLSASQVQESVRPAAPTQPARGTPSTYYQEIEQRLQERQNLRRKQVAPKSDQVNGPTVTQVVEEKEEAPKPSQYEEIEYQEGMSFGAEDEEYLLSIADHISDIDPEQADAAWETFAEEMANHHTAHEWRMFWEEIVKPKYLEQNQQSRDNGETRLAESGPRDEESLPEERQDKSPSYHPESPVLEKPEVREYESGSTLQNTSVTITENANHRESSSHSEEETTGQRELSPELPALQPRTPLSSLKRKLLDTSKEERHKRKHARLTFKILDEREELGSGGVDETPPEGIAAEGDDGQSEAYTHGEQVYTEERSDFEGYEDEEYSAVPRALSPTLSEPDYYYQNKIDAQLFDEIASSLLPRSDLLTKGDDGVQHETDEGDQFHTAKQEQVIVIEDDELENIEEGESGANTGENSSDIHSVLKAQSRGGNEDTEHRASASSSSWTSISEGVTVQLSTDSEAGHPILPQDLLFQETQAPGSEEPEIYVDGSSPVHRGHNSLLRFPSRSPSNYSSSLFLRSSTGSPRPPALLSSPFPRDSPQRPQQRSSSISSSVDGPLAPIGESVDAYAVTAEESASTDFLLSMDTFTAFYSQKGVTWEDLEAVLRSTCMNIPLADRALKGLLATGNIPSDIPGIWTDEDDERRVSRDREKRSKVTQKHGSQRLTEREKFLESFDEDDEDDDEEN